MRIRVKGLSVRSIMDRTLNRNPDIDLRYEVEVKFTAEELQNMHHMRGQHVEEVIDLIGEGIKSEMRRIHEKNKG
jgi:hypothetical protein